MLRRFLSLILMLSTIAASAQTVALTGTLLYQDNTAFNGRMVISLSKTTLNICTLPKMVVAHAPVTLTITNGAISGPNSFVPSYCLAPAVPYYVQLFDNNNAAVASMNWYIQGTPTNMNIGDMVLSNFGGPILVAVPQPIVATPAGSQTVTQPVGTSLSVNNFTVTNSFSVSTSTPSTNKAICWKSSGAFGHCISAVDSGGNCTCS